MPASASRAKPCPSPRRRTVATSSVHGHSPLNKADPRSRGQQSMTADLARRRSVPTVRQATGARFGHYVQVAASAATTRVEAWRPKVARGLVSCSPAPAAGVRAVFSASAAFASGGEGIVSETGVEGLGWLEERISELSERQAANARMVLERLESRSPRCPGAPGEATGHEHAIVRRRDRRGQYAKSRNVQLQRVLFQPRSDCLEALRPCVRWAGSSYD
jgi:hypothetical protein